MRKRLLIVDDEESIRKSLLGALSDEGYEVFTAQDGNEALDLVETTRPHLILLDIWMPQMDGMEVLRRLREDFPEVAVIMISGHGTIETAVKAAKLGAYDFIEKPLSLEKIIITIDHALREKSLETEVSLYRARFDVSMTIVGESPADHEAEGRNPDGRPHRQLRADLRGERHRQGARGAGIVCHGHAQRLPLCGGQLRGDPRGAHRERALRLRARAPLPAPMPGSSGSSTPPTAGRFFWTRSAT